MPREFLQPLPIDLLDFLARTEPVDIPMPPRTPVVALSGDTAETLAESWCKPKTYCYEPNPERAGDNLRAEANRLMMEERDTFPVGLTPPLGVLLDALGFGRRAVPAILIHAVDDYLNYRLNLSLSRKQEPAQGVLQLARDLGALIDKVERGETAMTDGYPEPTFPGARP